MPRLTREIVVTEKIDGTNAQIFIAPGYPGQSGAAATWFDEETASDMVMYAGSRSRWVTRDADNFGFASWVHDHAQELAALGPGSHFGEWWGAGIQRKYGLGEKRFSLFNADRWSESRPACCDVVPVLYRGMFCTRSIDEQVESLRRCGSAAAPGFMDPEGVVVFHLAGRVGFKKTLHKDELPKGIAA